MENNTAAAGQMQLTFSAERRIYRVSELSAALQRVFDASFRAIWVTGEISGCNLAPSGHHYFCLKDERSQVKCVLYRGAARFAKFKPRDGLSVIVRGNLWAYEPRGEYQLIVELLEPQGAGALQLAFEELKKKLAAEGLFETARKRPLPKLPRRIGIVTSPRGAVIRDMLHVLARRFPGVGIRLFPAQVQGDGAVEQVCRGLEYFGRGDWAEVVIVARGGGSLEDLWTFNEEPVARAIAASKAPVISAIGHETDFTIADFVADHRAPTPSAAAEVVICTRQSLLEQIETRRANAVQAMRYRLLVATRELHQRGIDRAVAGVERAIAKRMQRVDDLEKRLVELTRRKLVMQSVTLGELARRLQATDLRVRFAQFRNREQLLEAHLAGKMQVRLWQARQRHERLVLALDQLSPLAVLARGYAIVQDASERVVRSSAEVAPGDPIKVRLHEGAFDAVVSGTERGA